jgi:hypothetical protein
MVTDSFYYTRNIYSNEEQLFSLHTSSSIFTKEQLVIEKKRLGDFTTAYYETAKYLLMNNKGE